MIDISLKSSDILYLSATLYEVNNALATVIIVPGINEHKTRYQELIGYLNSTNMNCLVYDPRGQGRSVHEKNPEGYIGSSTSLVADLKIIVDYTTNRLPGLPIYMIADSLGALSALIYLEQNSIISKFILVSPMCASLSIDANIKSTKLLMNILGKNKESQVISSILGFSKDQVILKSSSALELLKQDPKCYFNYKNISIYNILEMEKNLHQSKNPLNNNIQVLILTGMLDKNLSGKTKVLNLIQDLQKRGLTNISYLEYPNMGHKILFEDNRHLVYQDMFAYLIS